MRACAFRVSGLLLSVDAACSLRSRKAFYIASNIGNFVRRNIQYSVSYTLGFISGSDSLISETHDLSSSKTMISMRRGNSGLKTSGSSFTIHLKPCSISTQTPTYDFRSSSTLRSPIPLKRRTLKSAKPTSDDTLIQGFSPMTKSAVVFKASQEYFLSTSTSARTTAWLS